MRTRNAVRALCLLLALLFSAAMAAPAAVADDPSAHASYGPPKPPPDAWTKGGWMIGTDKDGHWCLVDGGADNCQIAAGSLPGTIEPCSTLDDQCSAAGHLKWEQAALKKWENGYDHSLSNYAPLDQHVTSCVNGGQPFEYCLEEYQAQYPPPVKGPADWVAGKISEMASNALKEAAGQIGESVVWLLKQFADAFNSVSTITLNQTGIGQVVALSTALSAVIATFLLLIQFGKTAVSQSGAPLATALVGLAKWAVILAAYAFATQVALSWSDGVSTWIINYSFQGGGSGTQDATAAMQTQLGTLFSGLVAGGGVGTAGAALVTGSGVLSQAVGVVIVLGILCILAIGALWIEMLVRQAGIMILVAVMPIVLAGQVADATKEWWPKARNALVALVLMKPAIVIAFAIGFSAMAHADGIRNVIVGLIIFLLSCAAWPVIAKFMTFTTSGDGNSVGSGLFGAVGGSVSAMFGGYTGAAAGAGAVGGGSGYTRALEADNTSAAGSGSGGGFWKGGAGSFASKVGGSVGMGLQVAAAGFGAIEGAMGNAAAHAGLSQPAHMGGNVVVPPRHGGGGGAAAAGNSPATETGTAEAPPPAAPPGPRPAAPAVSAAPPLPSGPPSPPPAGS